MLSFIFERDSTLHWRGVWGSGWSWSAPVQQFCHLYAAHHHYHRFIVSGSQLHRAGVGVETGSGTGMGTGTVCLCCGSLWAMWHPHAPLANDAASGSLSRKNVLIAGVGNGGEILLLRIHKELIKNTKSRRSRHDNAKRDGRGRGNVIKMRKFICLTCTWLYWNHNLSVSLSVPLSVHSFPFPVCLWHGRCHRLLLWFLFLMLAMVHYSYQNRRGQLRSWRGNRSLTPTCRCFV